MLQQMVRVIPVTTDKHTWFNSIIVTAVTEVLELSYRGEKKK